MVRRGSGRESRLELVCDGCGKRTAYTGGAGLLEAHGVDATETAARQRFRPSRETLERWLPMPPALPFWVPSAYIILIISVGLAMIGFGVVNLPDGGQSVRTVAPPAPEISSPEAVAPSPVPVGPAGERRPRAPELDRVVVANRFTIGVPDGWRGGTSGGAVVFSSGSGAAELRVFLQPGTVSLDGLARQAESFLRDEHAAGKLGRSRPIRVGPLKARAITTRYPGGAERAWVLSADGYSYLLLNRIDRPASRSAWITSGAAMRSFRTI